MPFEILGYLHGAGKYVPCIKPQPSGLGTEMAFLEGFPGHLG